MNKRNELLYKAIDAIIDVVEDIPASDAHYFLNSEKSVVSRLRRLLIDENAKHVDYHFLYTRAYMGHIVYDRNGDVLTWQKLSTMKGYVYVERTVKQNGKEGTIAQTSIYQIV